MKKKIFAVALAATMALSSVMTAFGAASSTITGGWWSAWTPGYEVTGTSKFTIEVKGGDANWNNVSAVFTNVATDGVLTPNVDKYPGYKEYAVIRSDSWGWGKGDNLSADGNPIEYTMTYTEEGLDWPDFVAIMKDATIDATITKTADGISLKYVAKGANGKGFTYTATTKVDTSAGLYVFFACDTSTVTVTPVTEAATEAPAAGTTATTATTAGTGTPETSDVATTSIIILAAVAAIAVVVLKKKEVTE